MWGEPGKRRQVVWAVALLRAAPIVAPSKDSPFFTAQARAKLDASKRGYNESRPHTSLGDLTPAEFVRRQEQLRTQEAALLSL